MKKLVLAASIALAMLATGCATQMGNKQVSTVTAADVKQKIVAGKSTKADVEAQLGKPNTVQTAKNGDTWIYQYSEAKSDAASFIPVVGMYVGGITSNSKTVTVEFSAKGVVRDATYSESKDRLEH